MTTTHGNAEYQALLRNRSSETEVRTFMRFNDAVLWLSFEFNVGDGYAEYAEIRRHGTLLWRRKAPLAVS